MKNIILCFDGTWQKPGTGDGFHSEESNIRTLYNMFDKEDESAQVVCYDEGVGSHWYDHVLGGVFGRGLSKNIRDMYKELINLYEDGDKVYVYGCSRGAYSARSLCGFIYACGLLKKSSSNRKIKQAFELYKSNDLNRKINQKKYKKKNKLCPIEALGIFDTVGSLGIPFEMFDSINKYHNFHDTKVNREIKNVFHAKALDEKRKFFPLTPIDKNPNNTTTRIVASWFVGVHCDIGGGYKEHNTLKNISLEWMYKLSKESKVIFSEESYVFEHENPDKIYDSYTNFYKPFGERKRVVNEDDVIHSSALERMANDEDYNTSATLKRAI